ncbi:MAG: hypothetical protein IPK05_19310 [Comamonadaceae bacterium]|nr:hypothetical protein [Comamonadaceae bacterium]
MTKLIAIASEDASVGVPSSVVHAMGTGCRWSAGSWQRPRLQQVHLFRGVPFPALDTGLTPELTQRIRNLAEQPDAHRKAQQAAHPEVTLTGMYNVLEKLRSGEALTPSERTINERAGLGPANPA